jgi:hypothetical protein
MKMKMSIPVLLTAMILMCGCNTRQKSSYIVDNRCVYKYHMYLPPDKVIGDDGIEVPVAAISWDRWECPNGHAVIVSQSPAVNEHQ